MNLVDWRSSTWKTTARSRFAAQHAQVVLGDRQQLRRRALRPPASSRARRLEVLGHHLVEEGDQDVLLVPEVEVDGAVGDVGAARDRRTTRAAK